MTVTISDRNHNGTSNDTFVSQPKMRRYEENYLSLGFTKVIVNGEECPQCGTNFNSKSMRPTKLKR